MPTAFDPSAYRAAYYSLPREYRTAFATGFRAAFHKEINEYRRANPLRPGKTVKAKTVKAKTVKAKTVKAKTVKAKTAKAKTVEPAAEKPTALIIHLDRFRRSFAETPTPLVVASTPIAAAA
jgi:hypothetical protein